MLGAHLEVEALKKCTALWQEALFGSKTLKTLPCRTTFGGGDVQKVHGVVARSTFRSQNVKSTPCSDHCWPFNFVWLAHWIPHLAKSEPNVWVL